MTTSVNCSHEIEFRLPQPLRALLLDLDGTLVDSIGALRAAYEELLRSRARTPSDEEFRAINGPTLFEIAAYLKAAHSFEERLEDLQDEYQARVARAYSSLVCPMPGAAELIRVAHDSGIQAVLVTGALDRIVSPLLARLGWGSAFDAVITGENGTRGKPAPDLYRKALAAVQVAPGHALAVEDSHHGMAAARAAGVQVVLAIAAGNDSARGVGEMDLPTLAAIIGRSRARPLLAR